MHTYAIEVKKDTIPLIGLLNDGVEPSTALGDDIWFVLRLNEDGTRNFCEFLTGDRLYINYLSFRSDFVRHLHLTEKQTQ